MCPGEHEGDFCFSILLCRGVEDIVLATDYHCHHYPYYYIHNLNLGDIIATTLWDIGISYFSHRAFAQRTDEIRSLNEYDMLM